MPDSNSHALPLGATPSNAGPAGQAESAGKPLKLTIALVVVVIVAALGAGGMFWHHRRHLNAERAQRQQVAQAGPQVEVATAKATPGDRSVTLPGDVRSLSQTQLTARVSGYVVKMNVDVGSPVHPNDVLAVLESPEGEAQLRAAKADLMVKERLAARAKSLAPAGVVARQDLDTAVGNAQVARDTLKSAQANLDYATVRAPFGGVVAARYVDPGALAQPGTALLEVRDSSTLRVTAYAGQDVAAFLKVGDPADVVEDERPDHVVHANVSKLASALDARSRTMQVEIWVDNSTPVLVPGAYAHVTLHVQAPPLPTVPGEAVIERDGKDLVGVVADGHIHLVPVELGLNDGRAVQIRSGLKGGETVALNLAPEVGEGSAVQARPAKPEGDAGGPK